jgi:hypothetical protein
MGIAASVAGCCEIFIKLLTIYNIQKKYIREKSKPA